MYSSQVAWDAARRRLDGGLAGEVATLRLAARQSEDLVLRMSSLLRSSLELSDIEVYEPYIRALLGAASQFCEAGVVESRAVPNGTCPLDPEPGIRNPEPGTRNS